MHYSVSSARRRLDGNSALRHPRVKQLYRRTEVGRARALHAFCVCRRRDLDNFAIRRFCLYLRNRFPTDSVSLPRSDKGGRQFIVRECAFFFLYHKRTCKTWSTSADVTLYSCGDLYKYRKKEEEKRRHSAPGKTFIRVHNIRKTASHLPPLL